jgi:predicted CxxxxCH...CXXCH cytochrome family protein
MRGSLLTTRLSLILLLSVFAVGALPAAAPAAHKLQETNCYDCHAVGGAKDLVVSGTRLIKKDSRISELQGGGWTGGSTLPCVYCHDADASRTNRLGIKPHFTASSISTHPVDYLLSSQDSAEAASFAKCRDCHDQNIAYVSGGSSLNPNIHGVDADLAGWTTGSQRDPSDTWSNDPYNAGGNAMCENLCHFNGSPSDPAVANIGAPMDVIDWHGYDSSLVSIEAQSGFVSAGSVGGCLDDGTGTTGCHSPHHSEDNVNLITVLQDDATQITADECGACHTYDDGGAASVFETKGHGLGASTIFPDCSNCHNPSEPHFAADGSGQMNTSDPMRLLSEDSSISPLTSKYSLANCDNCHGTANFTVHNVWGVGCLDCHSPHGDGVGTNVFMIRNTIPVPSPASTLVAFADTSDTSYFDSSIAVGPGEFTGGLCDNVDCHSNGASPPGPYNDLVNSSTHPGGNVKQGCTGCHAHDDSGGSWRATNSCTQCHNSGADTGDIADSWPDTFAHAIHAGPAGTQYGMACNTCHPVDHDGTAEDIAFTGTIAATWASAVYDTTNMTCDNLYCHGAANTADWDNGTGGNCGDCHGAAGTGRPDNASEPSGGNHLTGSSSSSHSQVTCGTCHPHNGGPDPAHVDGPASVGNADADVGVAGSEISAFSYGAGYFSTSPDPDGYDYSDKASCTPTCHGVGNWGGVGGCDFCHGYPPTSANNNHAPGASPVDHDVHSTNAATLLSEHDDCVTCHGTKDGGGGVHAPNANYQVSTMHNDGNITMNGPVGTGAGYSAATWTCTNTCHSLAEIPNQQLSDSALPVGYGDFGAGSCDACHGPGGSGPTVVWPAGNNSATHTSYGSHLGATSAEETNSFLSTQNWSTQCDKCHTFHSGPALVDLPPTGWDNPATAGADNWNMRTRTGIDYVSNGGIHLGGTATSGANEAEICWNCHGTDTAVNEWGTNTDTSPGWPAANISGWAGASYDYGTIFSNSSWSTATSYWIDSGTPTSLGYYRRDGYRHDTTTTTNYRLSRRISSVHSADFGYSDANTIGSSVITNVSAGVVDRGATQTLEPRSALRCSYCHDVHDLNKANGGAGYTDGSSGPPYLRGTWFGNPYGPDMPPTTADSYSNTGSPSTGEPSQGNRYVVEGQTLTATGWTQATPRIYTSLSYQRGGYFIDQNSGWPTDDVDYDTLEETSGLCVLCHGTAVDTMDYYTTGTIWRFAPPSKNGHANAALGGTGVSGTYDSNLFDADRGTEYGAGVAMGAQDGAWLRTQSGTDNYGVDGSYGEAKAFGPYSAWERPTEPANSGNNQVPANNSGWFGGTPGTNTIGGQYSTWFGGTGIGTDGSSGATRAHNFTCSKCHSPHATGLPALLITNCLDQDEATWQGASTIGPGGSTVGNNWRYRVQMNCHRKDSTSTGWHNLSPSQ